MIDTLCEDYIANTTPPCLDDCGKHQLRKAFYAGAQAARITMQEIARPDIPLSVARILAQNLISELDAFALVEIALRPKPEKQN
jgi:hypothetical protein